MNKIEYATYVVAPVGLILFLQVTIDRAQNKMTLTKLLFMLSMLAGITNGACTANGYAGIVYSLSIYVNQLTTRVSGDQGILFKLGEANSQRLL